MIKNLVLSLDCCVNVFLNRHTLRMIIGFDISYTLVTWPLPDARCPNLWRTSLLSKMPWPKIQVIILQLYYCKYRCYIFRHLCMGKDLMLFFGLNLCFVFVFLNEIIWLWIACMFSISKSKLFLRLLSLLLLLLLLLLFFEGFKN